MSVGQTPFQKVKLVKIKAHVPMALSSGLSTEHPLEAGLEKPSAPLEGVPP